MKMRLKSIVWKRGKHYAAQCFDIDVASFGATEKRALANLKEALELYCEDNDKQPVARLPRPAIQEVAV